MLTLRTAGLFIISLLLQFSASHLLHTSTEVKAWSIGLVVFLAVIGLVRRFMPETTPKEIAVVLLLNIGFWCCIPVLRGAYYAYYRGGLDIAWYAQAIWKIAEGKTPIITLVLPLHHLSNHCEPIVYPLGWIYSLFKSFLQPYLFLYVAQACANLLLMGTTARILLNKIKDDNVLPLGIILLLFTNHFGFIAANHFEFHPPTFGLSLFLTALGLRVLGQRRWAVGLALLSSLCGELFIPIGITTSTLFALDSVKVQSKVVAGTGLAFILSCLMVWGYFSWGRGYFAITGNYSDFVGERYASFGSSVVDLVLAPVLQTRRFLSVIFEAEKLRYLIKLSLPFFAILLCIPFFRSRRRSIKWPYIGVGIALIAAPLAKVLLSNYASYLRNDVHYAADILPGFILICFGLSPVLDFAKLATSSLRLILVVALGSFQAALGPINLLVSPFETIAVTPELRRYLRELDPGVAVFTDNDVFLPQLAAREHVLASFSDSSIPEDRLPDVILLSWPPEHFNQGKVVATSFRRSFRSVGELIETGYRGTQSQYRRVGGFPSKEYGEVSAWMLVRK